METVTKTRTWGNSLGVVIPKEMVEEMRLRPEEEIILEVRKKENPLKELWGAFKFKKDPHKLIKEVRKDLESKWLR